MIRRKYHLDIAGLTLKKATNYGRISVDAKSKFTLVSVEYIVFQLTVGSEQTQM